MSSYELNHDEHLKVNTSVYDFSSNDRQGPKWRPSTLKYHIESLLQ